MTTTACSALDRTWYDRGDSKTSHNLPLLLTLVEQTAVEQQAQSRVLELASHMSWLVAQRLPVTVASPVCWVEQTKQEHIFADLVYATLTTHLHQGFRRVLLVPWGGGHRTGSLIEPARKVLSAVTGEEVSLTEMALPPVHVDGISSRSVFGGLSSVQTQLGPLLEAFPGWDRTWTRLSAGQVHIVLLRSGEGTVQHSQIAVWERPTIQALIAALCPQHTGFMTASERSVRQRDGEIYARYLASLLSAATEFLQP
jgi:hypothetical protein